METLHPPIIIELFSKELGKPCYGSRLDPITKI
jgi:hypothetical protein